MFNPIWLRRNLEMIVSSLCHTCICCTYFELKDVFIYLSQIQWEQIAKH